MAKGIWYSKPHTRKVTDKYGTKKDVFVTGGMKARSGEAAFKMISRPKKPK